MKKSNVILCIEVFIFTLGLSEVWFDNLTGEALWRTIPLELFDPDRHVFRQTTVSENAENIKKIIEIIKSLVQTCLKRSIYVAFKLWLIMELLKVLE